MGHNYKEAVVSYSSSDSAMIAKLASQGEDEWLGESQEFASSYIRGMSVKRMKGIRTRQEAQNIAYENDDFYWGSYIKAIPFAEAENTKTKNLRRRIEETQNKYNLYIDSHRVGDYKSAFVSCPNCQSKINRDYFVKAMKKCRKEDQCPICGAYMSSDTMRKILDGYKAKIKELEKQLQTEEKRLLNKPTHYLIIAGYHT